MINCKLKKRKEYKKLALPNACGHDGTGTLDHIIPLALGGADHESNYQMLCFECNLKKAAKLNQEYQDVILAQSLFKHLTTHVIFDEHRVKGYHRDIFSSLFGCDDFRSKPFIKITPKLNQWIIDYFRAFGVGIKRGNALDDVKLFKIPAKSHEAHCHVLAPDFRVNYDVSRIHRQFI